MRPRKILVGIFINCLSPEITELFKKAREGEKLPLDINDRLLNDRQRVSPALLRAVRHLRSKFRASVEYRFNERAGCRCRCSPGFRLFVREMATTTKLLQNLGGVIKFWGQDSGFVKCCYPGRALRILKPPG